MEYTWVVVYMNGGYYGEYEDTYYVAAETEAEARRKSDEIYGSVSTEIAYVAGPFIKPEVDEPEDDWDEYYKEE